MPSKEAGASGELAEHMKIPKPTLYKPPGLKIRKRWRFYKDVVDAWVINANVACGRQA